ncbi:MAG: U32 family peptidase C-terminal domain-containing protein, partial [Alphaproteobacteria bacterium]
IDKTDDSIILEIKHKIEKGDEIEFLSPYQFEPIKITVDDFYDSVNGKSLDVISTGHLGQSVRLPIPKDVLDKLERYCVARKFIGQN